MAEETELFNKRDGTITFLDNTGTTSYTVAFEDGDLSCTITGPSKAEALDRGVHTVPPSVRYVDDGNCAISFSFYLRDSGQGDVNLVDLATGKTGGGSTWVSTYGATAEVPAYTVRWDLEGTDHGGVDSRFEWAYCEIDSLGIAEGEFTKSTISLTSRSNYPTVSEP